MRRMRKMSIGWEQDEKDEYKMSTVWEGWKGWV